MEMKVGSKSDWLLMGLVVIFLVAAAWAISGCQSLRGVASDVGYVATHIQNQIPADESK